MKIIRIAIIIATLSASGPILSGLAYAQGPCGEFYVVLPGDTLSDIAELCQVTVTELLAANPEITDPTRLFVGLRLRIPMQEDEREPILAIAPMCGPPGTRVLLVASGFPPGVFVDLGIARQESEFSVAGRVRTNTFGKIETEVTIPTSAVPNRTYVIQAEASLDDQSIKGTSSEFSVTPTAEDPRQQLQYFIQSHDTLSNIAAKFGRSPQSILDANPGLSDPNQFQEGRRIVIPAIQPDEPRVSLNPACGPPGGGLQSSGENFPANQAIRLNLNKWLAESQQASSTNTDPAGKFTAELEIPENARVGEFWTVMAEAGNNPRARSISNLFAVTWPQDPNAPRIYTVRPEDTLNEIAERFGRAVLSIIAANPEIENQNQILAGTRLIIPRPIETVSISPTRGPAGSQIEVRGQGFPLNAKVEIGLGRRVDTYEVIETVITDEQGRYATQLVIPAGAVERQRWVVVAILARAGVTEVTAVSDPFIVTEANQFSRETLITIWPLSGPPGSELLVSAAGFPPNAPIQVGVARQDEEPQELIDTWTDINGTFASELIIPDEAQVGESWVVIGETISAPVVSATSEAFIVTSSQAALFHRVMIFPVSFYGRVNHSTFR